MVVLRKVEGKILKRIISPLAPLLKAPAVETDKECTIMCTGEDITIQASARELTILLQISSSSFDVFWCSESGMTKVDLFLLNQIFISTGNQDSITIAVDYGGALIHFLFLHHRKETQSLVLIGTEGQPDLRASDQEWRKRRPLREGDCEPTNACNPRLPRAGAHQNRQGDDELRRLRFRRASPRGYLWETANRSKSAGGGSDFSRLGAFILDQRRELDSCRGGCETGDRFCGGRGGVGSEEPVGKLKYNLLRGNPITEYKDGVIFDDSKCEYDKVVVGIPSEQFRRILRHFEDSPFVCAVVTEAAVTFYSEPEDIVLKAEDGGCIIGDIMDDLGRVMILIFLVHPQSYIEASTLCDSVWIFHSSETRLSPNLVNFPVRGVGNLKFYLADWFAKSVI
ncbi:hypothetical protein U1Q18_023542 [Sarracenia purpurea var. burkii]